MSPYPDTLFRLSEEAANTKFQVMNERDIEPTTSALEART